jgi:hypothetical protein
MSAPLKKAPDAGELTGQQILIYSSVYHALDLLQTPFGFAFWMIEQCKARVQDKLANEGLWL